MRQEGGELTPLKAMPNTGGARSARRRWMGADGNGGSEGGGNKNPKTKNELGKRGAVEWWRQSGQEGKRAHPNRYSVRKAHGRTKISTQTQKMGRVKAGRRGSEPT